MQSHALTIVIPTFDRPSEASKRLQEISHQFRISIDVCVQVNPGKYRSSDIIVPSALENCKVEENEENLGFTANILKGLRTVSTRWVWILGDDDKLRPNLDKLLSESINTAESSNADAMVFNHWNHTSNDQITACRSISDYIASTGFTDCLFISSTIWKTSYLKKNLGILVDYSFTCAAQSVIKLSTLAQNKGIICVRQRALISHESGVTWSRISFLSRVDKIFYHESLMHDKKRLLKWMWPSIEWALTTSACEINTFQKAQQWMTLLFKYSINFREPKYCLRSFKIVYDLSRYLISKYYKSTRKIY